MELCSTPPGAALLPEPQARGPKGQLSPAEDQATGCQALCPRAAGAVRGGRLPLSLVAPGALSHLPCSVLLAAPSTPLGRSVKQSNAPQSGQAWTRLGLVLFVQSCPAPRMLSSPGSPRCSHASPHEGGRVPCALLSPATQAPIAGWACVQVAWAGNFLLGPWFVGRLMAERPLGAVGAGWALLKVRHE